MHLTAPNMVFRALLAKLGLSRDGFISAAQRALPYYDRVLMWSAEMPEYEIIPNSPG